VSRTPKELKAAVAIGAAITVAALTATAMPCRSGSARGPKDTSRVYGQGFCCGRYRVKAR
jgi:hypothetical protein